VKPEWTGSLIHNNEGTTAFTRPGASNFLHDRITVVGETFYNTCLARVLAHEAAHGVFATLPYDAFHNDSEFNLGQFSKQWGSAGTLGLELPDNFGMGSHHGNIVGRKHPQPNDPQPLQDCVTCK
jgi:hypothetical protein